MEKKNETKKKLDSYLTVLSNELGREPTFDEFKSYLSKDSSSVETPVASKQPDYDTNEEIHDAESDKELRQESVEKTSEEKRSIPKILKIRVHYGLSDKNGERSPDPEKVLFYSTPEGQCYDCKKKLWLDEQPGILQHLNHRPIEAKESDIIRAIAHGIMDKDDIDALSGKELLSDSAMLLWEKMNKLNDLYQEYEDMKKAEEDDIEDPIIQDEEGSMVLEDEDSVDTESVDYNQDKSSVPILGEDHVAEIIQLALGEPKNRDIIRSIVQEEIQKILSEDDFEDEDEEI